MCSASFLFLAQLDGWLAVCADLLVGLGAPSVRAVDAVPRDVSVPLNVCDYLRVMCCTSEMLTLILWNGRSTKRRIAPRTVCWCHLRSSVVGCVAPAPLQVSVGHQVSSMSDVWAGGYPHCASIPTWEAFTELHGGPRRLLPRFCAKRKS